MVKVKYSEYFSQDGYDYRTFDTYEDFGYWVAKNYQKVHIYGVEEK